MLTIKLLKELIKDVPDDAIFSSMAFGNKNELDFFVIKRALIVKEGEITFFVLNQMGTHWNEKWEKENYKLIKTIEK
jgi:hypothetical protein